MLTAFTEAFSWIAPLLGIAIVVWVARRYDHPALPDRLRSDFRDQARAQRLHRVSGTDDHRP